MFVPRLPCIFKVSHRTACILNKERAPVIHQHLPGFYGKNEERRLAKRGGCFASLGKSVHPEKSIAGSLWKDRSSRHTEKLYLESAPVIIQSQIIIPTRPQLHVTHTFIMYLNLQKCKNNSIH